MGLQAYVDSLKASASSLAVNTAMTFLAAEAPWIKLPIIKQVVEYLVKRVTNAVIDSTEMGAFFLYTDIRVNKQGIAFEQAAYKNYIAQKEGTDEERTIAEAELMAAFKSFISFTN